MKPRQGIKENRMRNDGGLPLSINIDQYLLLSIRSSSFLPKVLLISISQVFDSPRFSLASTSASLISQCRANWLHSLSAMLNFPT